jgi:hypothetical protein
MDMKTYLDISNSIEELNTTTADLGL